MTANLKIRPLENKDKPSIMRFLAAIPEFDPEEIPVAEEVLDCYLDDPLGSGYSAIVAELDSSVVGYITFGLIPLTQGAWDVYWVAVAPGNQGRGVGKALLASAEAAMKTAKARMVLIETSGKVVYEKTMRFYESQDYKIVCRIPDFYAPGDPKLVYQKLLG